MRGKQIARARARGLESIDRSSTRCQRKRCPPPSACVVSYSRALGTVRIPGFRRTRKEKGHPLHEEPFGRLRR